MPKPDEPKKRGPRGGVKHQPGRGHDRKSHQQKQKRFERKAAQKRKRKDAESQMLWAQWDALPEEVKRLLGPSAKPRVKRPGHA